MLCTEGSSGRSPSRRCLRWTPAQLASCSSDGGTRLAAVSRRAAAHACRSSPTPCTTADTVARLAASRVTPQHPGDRGARGRRRTVPRVRPRRRAADLAAPREAARGDPVELRETPAPAQPHPLTTLRPVLTSPIPGGQRAPGRASRVLLASSISRLKPISLPQLAKGKARGCGLGDRRSRQRAARHRRRRRGAFADDLRRGLAESRSARRLAVARRDGLKWPHFALVDLLL